MFNPQIINFFESLENNNNKDWFDQHKKEYQELVKEPIQELTESLAFEYGNAHIYRINRDVRFSNDKSPYKTSASFLISVYGDFGLYFEINKNRLLLAGGSYNVQSDQLQKWRLGIENTSLDEIKNFISKVKKEGFELDEDGMLTSTPRGYSKDHPDQYFLRLKKLALIKSYPIQDWIFTEKLNQKILDDFKILRKWSELLDKHVGPSKIQKHRH